MDESQAEASVSATCPVNAVNKDRRIGCATTEEAESIRGIVQCSTENYISVECSHRSLTIAVCLIAVVRYWYCALPSSVTIAAMSMDQAAAVPGSTLNSAGRSTVAAR
jgi:hypothetical protein